MMPVTRGRDRRRTHVCDEAVGLSERRRTSLGCRVRPLAAGPGRSDDAIGVSAPLELRVNHSEDAHPLPFGIGPMLLRSLLPAVVLAVVGAVAVYAISLRVEPTYKAVATVLASNTDPSLARFDVALASPPAIDLAAYRSVVLSRPIVDRARASVSDPLAFDEARISASADIMNISSLIRIEARSDDPVIAADVANAMALALLDWDQQRSRDNLNRIMAALEEQIAALTEQILILQVTPGVAADQLDGQVRLRAERQQQLVSVRALSASVVGMLDIIEPAAAPDGPIIPMPTTYAVVAFVALLLVVTGTGVLGHVLDRRPRTSADVSRAMSLPVLAEFGAVRRRDGFDVQAFGYLRANLDPQIAETFPVVLLVTSPTTIPGRERLARGIAMTFVEDGLETLFVDADFTASSPAALLASGGPTLEDHLDVGAEELVEPGRASEGLYVLGNLGAEPGAANHLLRRGFARAAQAWKQRYDVIVVDTAPLLEGAEALSIMPSVSGAVLVVDMRNVRRSELRQTLAMMRRGRVLGLAMVNAQPSAGRASIRAVRSPDVTLHSYRTVAAGAAKRGRRRPAQTS